MNVRMLCLLTRINLNSMKGRDLPENRSPFQQCQQIKETVTNCRY